MRQAVAGMVAGATSVSSAAGFLWRERRLWGLCAAPILTTALLFALAIGAFFGWALDPLSAWLGGYLTVAAPEAWYEWIWVGPLRALAWLLQILVAVAFFAVLYLVFLALGGVLAAPFLDVLSRRVEEIEAAHVVEVAGGLGGILWSMLQELRRAAFLLGGGLGIAILGWIPGAQPLAVVAAGLFAALFVPLEYTGFLLDRRAIGFRERRQWLWSHRATMLGFGGMALVTLLVPVLNFLCLPLLVTAGTRLALRLGPPLPAPQLPGDPPPNTGDRPDLDREGQGTAH